MKRSYITAVALVAALGMGVAGCQTNAGTKQTVGGVGGAVAGGLLGSQIGGGRGQLIATGAGAVLGALVGSEIGRNLDQVDRMEASRTTQRALETAPAGTTSSWSNPDSGNSGTVTPTRTYQAADNRHCREFTQTINVGGRTEEAYGTACRQPDGSWQIQ